MTASAHKLISYKYEDNPRFPPDGEIIAVRFNQDLVGPGSPLPSGTDLPSRATTLNYHHAIVLAVGKAFDVFLWVFPILTFTIEDPISRLSSTEWLLSQPDDFQRVHVPLLFNAAALLGQTQLSLTTPTDFGAPLKVEGWKSIRPSWVQAVPQRVVLKQNTLMNTYDPPLLIDPNDVDRLLEYSKQVLPPHLYDQYIPAPPPNAGDAHSLSRGSNHGEKSPIPRGSTALEGLYAPAVVGGAFRMLFRPPPLSAYRGSDSDDYDGDDDDYDVNDDHLEFVDMIDYARRFPDNPTYVKIVEDHDRETRARLERDAKNWAQEVAVANPGLETLENEEPTCVGEGPAIKFGDMKIETRMKKSTTMSIPTPGVGV